MARAALQSPLRKLIAMRILVTLAACRWRAGELHMNQRALKIWRFVALHAIYRSMRTEQRELCCGVVEPRNVLPLLGAVARFATLAFWIARRGHAFSELSLVHVFVTRCTVEAPKVIRNELGACGRLVAFVARDGHVSACQREMRLLMLLQRVTGYFECGARMALLACVQPRRCRELSLMLVLMAIHATLEGYLEPRLRSCRDVALSTRHLLVREDYRKAGLAVVRKSEGGGLPALYRVAAFAFAAVRAGSELPAVRIRRMAVSATRMGNGFLEVGALVAGDAGNLSVLA